MIKSLPITELENLLASSGIDVTKLINPVKGKKLFVNKDS